MEKPIDMKMSKAEMKESMPTTENSKGGPKYPWGLQLRLDETALDKLGMKSS